MTKRDMARRRGDSGGHSVKQKAIGVEGDGGGGPVEAVFVETGGRVEGEGGGGEGGGVGGVVVCGAGGGGLEDEVEGVGCGGLLVGEEFEVDFLGVVVVLVGEESVLVTVQEGDGN